MSASDYSIFFTRPLATTILAINAVVLIITMLPSGTLGRMKRSLFG
jgi:TctA family transporter